MERTIKFRGKDCDTKEWHYGDLITWCGAGQPQIKDWLTDNFGEFDVETESIGQFTGEADKNGIQIFEGDIVQLEIIPPTYNGKNPTPYKDLRYVAWEQQKRAYVYRKIKKHPGKHSRNVRDVWMGHGKVRTVEVIGNIHDNPDMMEGAEP